MPTYIKDGIKYKKPEVFLLQYSDPMVAEYFGRRAYDSFDKSENNIVKQIKNEVSLKNNTIESFLRDNSNKQQDSALLEELSHVYFHGSVLEHINLSFFIKGISRAVLQELMRHRIASPTVKSTRYTLSDIINNFVAVILYGNGDYNKFYSLFNQELLTTDDVNYNNIVIRQMFDKLMFQKNTLGQEEFLKLCLIKDMQEKISSIDNIKDFLNEVSKKAKRNIGDPFKHIIDENLSVDLGFTINLRSLKNLLDLRLNGSAWFQIQILAAEMFNTLPVNLKKLVDNKDKNTFQNRTNKIKEI